MASTTLDTRQRRAFEQELSPLQDGLYRAALRLARDPSVAEDLVQDSVLKAYRFFGTFKEGTNFRAWLYRVLYTVFINRTREKTPISAPLIQGADPMDETLAPDADVDRASHRERVSAVLEASDDRIKHAVEDLPEDLRTVFLLSTVEGLKYREIAEIMECPLGTVMSRLFRSRRLLQEKLADLAQETGYSVTLENEEPMP